MTPRVAGARFDRLTRGGWKVGLGAILVLAAILRFTGLGTPGLVEDEAYQSVVAFRWAETGSPIPPSGIPYLRAFPLIALQAVAVKIIPGSLETAVRLPLALFGLVNVVLAWLLGRRYGGTGLGLLAAFVFAVSTWCIETSTMSRMYEMLATGSLLTLHQYERLVERPSWWRLAGLVLALWIGLSAHALGLLLAILPIAGILVHRDRAKVVALLAVATASQLFFWVMSKRVLDRLFPQGGAQAYSPEKDRLLEIPPLRAQRALASDAIVPWILVLAIVAAGVVLWLRRRGKSSGILTRVSVALAGLSAAAGFFVVSVFIALAHDVFAHTSSRSEKELREGRIAHGAVIGGALVLWGALAGFVAIRGGAGRAVRLVKDALEYPEVWKSMVVPLLTSPHAIVFVHLAALAGVLFLLRPKTFEARFLGNRSFAARLLLLLGASLVLSAAESYYKAARYIYFLYGIGLLCVLEVFQELYRRSGRIVRAGLAVAALVLLLGVELPAAFAQLPRPEGRPVREALAWLPDYGTRSRIARNRQTIDRDYRSAGAFLRTHMAEGDLLLADAAHQMQPYVATIHGHLAPPLREYAQGARHYFTGSVLLRTPDELESFLDTAPGTTRIWVVITGYASPWTDLLSVSLAGKEMWANGPIHVYSTTAADLLQIAQSDEAPVRPAA